MKIRLRGKNANIDRFASFLIDRVLLLPPPPPASTQRESLSNEQRFRGARGHGRVLAHHETDGTSNDGKSCLKCQKAHNTSKCFILATATLADRDAFVTQNSICRSCLNSTEHQWQDCPEKPYHYHVASPAVAR